MKSTRDNIVIGIDTSCYTTSIAAISLNKEIIFNEKIMLNVDTNSKGLDKVKQFSSMYLISDK